MKQRLQEKPDVAQTVPPPASKKARNPPFVKYYLIAYNTLSALGWSYVLVLTLIHLFNLDWRESPATGTQTATSILLRFIWSWSFWPDTETKFFVSIPPFLQPLIRRAATTYACVGVQTAFVQTAALLEVLHVLLGWVRSPLPTTAMQVSSRLFLVWGITEQFEIARFNPLYASMVIAWSLTEVIRYSFYACMLVGYEPRFLFYLRYTTFYVLYPLGAGSEALLIFATLPLLKESSFVLDPWSHPSWKLTDYIRGLLFVIWWPGLYILYTHMIRLRRKVIHAGPGRILGSKPKSM